MTGPTGSVPMGPGLTGSGPVAGEPSGAAAARDAAGRLRYRVLTGPDDAAFCERVSQALAEGYRLHGGPALTFDGSRVIVAQAVVLPTAAAASIQEA